MNSRSGTHFNTASLIGKKAVGAWQIGRTLWFYVAVKPTEEQIKNTEELLGWKWVNEEIN